MCTFLAACFFLSFSRNHIFKGGANLESFQLAFPEFILPVFGGINVTQSVVTSWICCAAIAVVFIVFGSMVRRFEEQPRGLQNVIEFVVELSSNATKRVLGDRGEGLAPYLLTLGFCFFSCTFCELLGFRPPLTSLSSTGGMALISFFLINYYAIRVRGLKGRIKLLGSPVPFLAPINLITDLSVPISMACRLFGNTLAGMIILKLVYAKIPLVIPALLSIYFNGIHPFIQAYIFIILTLTFIEEKTEDVTILK
jgi:F-type H+-transporting ATPase subunit a